MRCLQNWWSDSFQTKCSIYWNVGYLGVCLQCLCLQCFDAVGLAAGRASGLKKLEWSGAGIVIWLERGADLHMAQLMPLSLTGSCFSKIQIGFSFLVPAHLGSPGKRAVKRRCVSVCGYLGAICVLNGMTHGYVCLLLVLESGRVLFCPRLSLQYTWTLSRDLLF